MPASYRFQQFVTMQTLPVTTAGSTYPILFGAEANAALETALSQAQVAGRSLFAVIDTNVINAHPAYWEDLLGTIPRFAVPSGEGAKSFSQLEALAEAMAEARLDRGGLLIAIGGGVTGDLAGFAAAAYLRGIAFLQVPTTLLAMVDSSVGGKTGINLAAGKNLFGAFHQPEAVFINPDLLRSLPPREFSAGMAEVIKYGLLADADLFQELESTPRLTATDPRLLAVVRRCCAIKAQVVAADERETAQAGGRALLNLGHTFAHAVEAIAGYGTYLHGEAVAIGLVCAARLSVELGWVPPETVERVAAVCTRYGLPVTLRTALPSADLLAAMQRDKKVRHGRLRFVAMRAIGDAITVDDVESTLVETIWASAGASTA